MCLILKILNFLNKCKGFFCKRLKKYVQYFVYDKYIKNRVIMIFLFYQGHKHMCLPFSGSHQYKEKLINEMNFKSVKHAEPFYELSTSKLMHIHRVTKRDSQQGYCKNRLYYIAEHIKVR